MACLWSHGRKANPFAGMWRSSSHWSTPTCSLQLPPPVLLPSWPPPEKSRNTAHWKTGTSSSPLLWSLLAPWTVVPQVLSRPWSEDFARVWRRQGNHVFVSTHFCFVISFQFCFVTQQLWVGRPLGTLASPFFLNFFNFFLPSFFRGFIK